MVPGCLPVPPARGNVGITCRRCAATLVQEAAVQNIECPRADIRRYLRQRIPSNIDAYIASINAGACWIRWVSEPGDMSDQLSVRCRRSR